MIDLPKDVKIRKVLLLGAGPTVMGQGAEYDAAAVEVCRVLKEEGCEVVALDSNPASLATDPGVAGRVYMTPLTCDCIRQIMVKEKPDLVLAGFGGQNALNLLFQLNNSGELNGAGKFDLSQPVLESTQNRGGFRKILENLGLKCVPGGIADSVKIGVEIGLSTGFPLIVRPSFSMAGSGSTLVYNQEELKEALEQGLSESLINQVSVEKALVGWNEIEYQILRDTCGKVVFLGAIAKMDPVGVHSGNSITIISPDAHDEKLKRVQEWITRVLALIGAVGAVNLKIACHPVDDEMQFLDVNPRFTLSSSLITMVSGISVAAMSAKIAIGYTLDELISVDTVKAGKSQENSFVALKFPYFDFRRFAAADTILGPSVKAVSQLMAFGGNLKEALQKGMRAAGDKRWGFGATGAMDGEATFTAREMREKLLNPNEDRLFYMYHALKKGMTGDDLRKLTKISAWVVKELTELVAMEKELNTYALYNLPKEVMLKAKQWGYSDRQLAYLLRVSETDLRQARLKLGIRPIRKEVGRDGFKCSFIGYELKEEAPKSSEAPAILMVGAGAHRIITGSEYDWSLIHAAKALKSVGRRVILVSADPATISMIQDFVDRIYAESLNGEEILNIIQLENIEGVLLQFGGESAMAIYEELIREGVTVLGTGAEDLAELLNAEKFGRLLDRLQLSRLGWKVVENRSAALKTAAQTGFPLVIHTAEHSANSTVRVVANQAQLLEFIEEFHDEKAWPMIVQKWIPDAVGVSVDCIGDGVESIVTGIAEQIETAEVHPGDSALSFPPYSLDHELIERITGIARMLLKELAVCGPVNLRLAVKHDAIHVLEVTPWAGATMAFISKATGIDWPAVAVKALIGQTLRRQQLSVEIPKHTAVKEAVFSFKRFPGVDTVLGPEKRSSGIVMGIDSDFGMAFVQSQLAAGENLPVSGRVYLSIRNEDKRAFITIAKQLADLGFQLVASDETAAILNRNTIPCETVYCVGEGRPNILDLIKNGEIQWIINTPSETHDKSNERLIRSTAVLRDIPMITTLSGALAVVSGLKRYIKGGIGVTPFNEYFERL